MQRARSPEAKTIRLVAILDATARCFDEVGPDLTLDQVATAAGLTRTTLYGYAVTREELLLLLTARELDGFFDALALGIRRRRSANGVARLFAEAVIERPRLAPLLASCSVVFERNISLGAAVTWKQHLHDQLLATGAHIDSALRLDEGSGARFVLHVHAVVTGLHGVAFPPEVAAKAITDAGLDALRVDFADELIVSLTALAGALLTAS